MAKIRIFPSSEAIARRFVQLLVSCTSIRVPGARPLYVALSGGSTPKLAYEKLAEADIAPTSLRLYMVDERYVPPTDDRSNETMIRTALKGRFDFKGMYREGGAERAANSYNDLLRSEVDKLDLVLLGMGDDGHTASLFPGLCPEAPDGAWCVPSQAPVVCRDRITLTPRALTSAGTTIFLATGQGKAERVREVLEGPRDWERLPAQYISAHSIACEWWLDEAAGSQLTSLGEQKVSSELV